MTDLANRISSMREQRGMTQQQLADQSGLQQSDISKLERGDSKKTTEIVGLARALRCNPFWLDDGKGDPDSPPGWPYELFSHADYALIDVNYRRRVENELAGEVMRAKKPNGTYGRH